MAEKVFILDGHSLAHRAFFALPPLTTKSGVPTNAVYGFTMMLMRLLESEKPDFLMVAFDRSAPTFRHQAFQDYKAQRRKMPDDLRSQFSLIRRVLEAFGIPVYEQDGYEADDIIGTLARQAAARGFETMIVTGDRDAFQLAGEHTRIMITRKGITDIDNIGPEELAERYQLTPDQIPDLKGLMGDTSDNIPGVPGIGEKTALRLLHQFKTVENLLARRDEVARPRERELLEQYAEQALTSKKLATICCDAPVELDPDRARRVISDPVAIAALFTEMEFYTLAKRVLGAAGLNRESGTARQEVIKKAETNRPVPAMQPVHSDDIESLRDQARETGMLAFQFLCSRSSWESVDPYGLAVMTREGETGYWISLCGEDTVSPEKWGMLFDIAGVKYICHDLKSQLLVLDHFGIGITGRTTDTMVLGYLADPAAPNLSLDELATRVSGQGLGGCRDAKGRLLDPLNPAVDLCPGDVRECAGSRTQAVLTVRRSLAEQVETAGMTDLFDKIEKPLIPVLFEMEKAGITVDTGYLNRLGHELGDRITALSRSIYEMAGEKFNLNSPKQLGVVLFDHLGLPAAKKTKTGYSTDADTLEDLSTAHPVVPAILAHRQLVKLKSTYIDALPQLINTRTGRIHTTFNQTVTATGRLSSTDPNLQNIPIRSEEGSRIRRAFIPGDDDWLILTADYSQIELRVMAHLSGDPGLIHAFRSGEDIHRRTAAEIFGLKPDDVDDSMREHAKAVNFGVIYGISGFGLSRGTGVSRKEAEQFIRKYFERYPGVSRFVDETIRIARETGYVTTLFKRRRYLPDLMAANRNVRAFAERMARNTPVQGTAADLIKLAMVQVQEKLRESGLRSRLLLQVHDELVFETPREEQFDLARLVKPVMEQVIEFQVPLVVDIKAGANWGDAKKSAVFG